MSEVEEKAKILVRYLMGHQEKKLRAFYLGEKIKFLEVEEIAEILNLICLRANAKKLPYLKAYNAIPELFRSLTLNREKVQKLRAVARRKDYFEVLQMLLDLPPKDDIQQLLTEDPFLKDLTLGARISLAKTQGRDFLKKLLKVQQPAVIRALLVNPRITETEVLKIASLKPTSPRVLEEIFKNPKWIARYRVKKALVYNPFCPPTITLYLLKFMVAKDLREIAQNENLHLAVQECAYQLLHDVQS